MCASPPGDPRNLAVSGLRSAGNDPHWSSEPALTHTHKGCMCPPALAMLAVPHAWSGQAVRKEKNSSLGGSAVRQRAAGRCCCCCCAVWVQPMVLSPKKYNAGWHSMSCHQSIIPCGPRQYKSNGATKHCSRCAHAASSSFGAPVTGRAPLRAVSDQQFVRSSRSQQPESWGTALAAAPHRGAPVLVQPAPSAPA